MPGSSTKRDALAYDYAERLCERLPRRMQELREASGLTPYKLWRKCGISRNTISCIESGKRKPGVAVLAHLAKGMG